MRIPRFYCSNVLNVGKIIALPAKLHKHAVQVLRLQVGEALILFNGQGGEYQASLIESNKRTSRVQIERFNPVERESSLHSLLALSVIKPDKMDYALQKSVELGVTAIQPLMSERSVIRLKKARLSKKMQHWQAVIQSACEQSGRTRLAQLREPLSLPAFLAEKSPQDLGLLFLPKTQKTLSTIDYQRNRRVITLIGPEGGFSDNEVVLCEQAGCVGIDLGKRILRTETAASAVLAIIHNLWEHQNQS